MTLVDLGFLPDERVDEFVERVQHMFAERGIVVSPVVEYDPESRLCRVQFEIMSTLN